MRRERSRGKTDIHVIFGCVTGTNAEAGLAGSALAVSLDADAGEVRRAALKPARLSWFDHVFKKRSQAK